MKMYGEKDVIKVYIYGPKNKTQIRRLVLSSEISNKLDVLLEKVQEFFPSFSRTNYEMTWKDDEGDVINIFTNEELNQVLEDCSLYDNLLKIYLRPTADEEKNSEDNQSLNKTKASSPLVTRDEPDAQLSPGKVRGVSLDQNKINRALPCNPAKTNEFAAYVPAGMNIFGPGGSTRNVNGVSSHNKSPINADSKPQPPYDYSQRFNREMYSDTPNNFYSRRNHREWSPNLSYGYYPQRINRVGSYTGMDLEEVPFNYYL